MCQPKADNTNIELTSSRKAKQAPKSLRMALNGQYKLRNRQ